MHREIVEAVKVIDLVRAQNRDLVGRYRPIEIKFEKTPPQTWKVRRVV